MLQVGEPGDHEGVLLAQVIDHRALDLADLLALGHELAVGDADVFAGDAQHGFLPPTASLPWRAALL